MSKRDWKLFVEDILECIGKIAYPYKRASTAEKANGADFRRRKKKVSSVNSKP